MRFTMRRGLSPHFVRATTLLISTALLLAAAATGCSHPGGHTATPDYNTVEDTTLGPGDVFKVQVYGEKELSGKYRVSAEGKIDFPLVGSLKVVGMTPPKVAVALRERLAKGFLKDPHVSVFVDTYQSKKISVFGAVRRPGTFKYVNNMSIVEAITRAGGFTPLASKNDVTVTRVIKGKKMRIKVAVATIGDGRAPNFLLRPGDVVFVLERVF